MLDSIKSLLSRREAARAVTPPEDVAPETDENKSGAISRAANRHLEEILSALPDAVLVLDGRGNIALANDAAKALLRGGDQALLGRPFGWALPNEAAIATVREVQESGVAASHMIELPDRLHLRLDIARIEGSSGSDLLVSLTDLTEHHLTDQVRRDFVANVSHELRTPLASIKAVIETLESGGLEDPAAARDFLSRANNEVDRLTRLVEELLELSRIEAGVALASERLDIGRTISSAVDRLRPQAKRGGVRLDVDLTADLRPVRGDAERLERVVVNLVQNAINFTAEGGSISVRARRRNGNVSIGVSDTGAGISPEDLPRLFERFYKVDRARGSAGTGLGLAIVKHTVEAHGGSVTVESRLGEGSTFTIVLPVAAD